ncbi:MAG: hypothetical protein LBN30_01625 [Oscillospiraceae bacterium]|jgi:hypothetical protein|nr:hypothetical protein [Oscillospiraceae bacterium]
MNIYVLKTFKTIARKIENGDLHGAYEYALRLRSQLLGVIYDNEMFAASKNNAKLADKQSEGYATDDSVTLKIDEPLPPLKDYTSAVQEHWSELVNAAIAKAARERKLPRFEKALVWIEVTTPRGTNNAQLWDTSNRAVNLIINNLKGVFFEDDNLEHLAFGVVGKWGEKGVTIVRISSFVPPAL